MPNELVLRKANHLVDKCLTSQCNQCSGSYINKLTSYQLSCNCKCHNKKMLEQRVVQPSCSNTLSQHQHIQQPEVAKSDD